MRSARSGPAGAPPHGPADGRSPGRLLQSGRAEPVERFLGDGHSVPPCRGVAPMLEPEATTRSASSAGTAPSRSTRGSGPVKSITVEAVPGKRAAVDDAAGRGAQLRRARRRGRRVQPARHVRARRDVRPDAGESTSRTGPVELRDADADRLWARARQPAESPPRVRAGSACTARAAVPGRSSAPAAVAPGRTRAGASRSADDDRGRLRLDAPLRAIEPADGVLAVRRGREPVDGVGRDDREPARLDRRDGVVDVSHGGPRRPGPGPLRSGVVATSRVAELRRASRPWPRLPVADLEHERARRRGARRPRRGDLPRRRRRRRARRAARSRARRASASPGRQRST